MAQQKFDWQAIDTVILDLDGTLIDLYFDHRFWKRWYRRRMPTNSSFLWNKAAN